MHLQLNNYSFDLKKDFLERTRDRLMMRWTVSANRKENRARFAKLLNEFIDEILEPNPEKNRQYPNRVTEALSELIIRWEFDASYGDAELFMDLSSVVSRCGFRLTREKPITSKNNPSTKKHYWLLYHGEQCICNTSDPRIIVNYVVRKQKYVNLDTIQL